MSEKELSVKDVILIVQENINYVFKKWIGLVIGIILALIVGWLYTSKQHNFYVAEVNIVNESSATPNYNALSAFGIDPKQDGGMFAGQNLIWLYTSQSMIENTLLKKVEINNQKDLLINFFLKNTTEIAKNVENNPTFKGITFDKDVDTNLNSLDKYRISLLLMSYNYITKELITVESIQNTEGIINVKMLHENEEFAKEFVTNLVNVVNEYYINTKTSKFREQVIVLENKVAQLDNKLNVSLVDVAESIEEVPYPNPNLPSIKVQPQRQTVDLNVNSSSYTNMLQQLENAKVRLSQQTPLIHVVDEPYYPLRQQKPKLIFNLLIASIIGLIISAGIIILRYNYRKLMAS